MVFKKKEAMTLVYTSGLCKQTTRLAKTFTKSWFGSYEC